MGLHMRSASANAAPCIALGNTALSAKRVLGLFAAQPGIKDNVWCQRCCAEPGLDICNAARQATHAAYCTSTLTAIIVSPQRSLLQKPASLVTSHPFLHTRGQKGLKSLLLFPYV